MQLTYGSWSTSLTCRKSRPQNDSNNQFKTHTKRWRIAAGIDFLGSEESCEKILDIRSNSSNIRCYIARWQPSCGTYPGRRTPGPEEQLENPLDFGSIQKLGQKAVLGTAGDQTINAFRSKRDFNKNWGTASPSTPFLIADNNLLWILIHRSTFPPGSITVSSRPFQILAWLINKHGAHKRLGKRILIRKKRIPIFICAISPISRKKTKEPNIFRWNTENLCANCVVLL